MLQSWWQQYGKGSDMGVLFRFLQTFGHSVFNYNFLENHCTHCTWGIKSKLFYSDSCSFSVAALSNSDSYNTL